MKIAINEICAFTNSTPSCRNFIEGERVLNAEHVIFCGKRSVDENCAHFLVFCLQTSSMRSNPHEIAGSISFIGKVVDIKCSCKAGLSKKCKHSVAVLLHLNRIDVLDLDFISSTDTKCLWKEPYTKSIEKYTPTPLFSHDCIGSKSKSKEYLVKLNEEDKQKINDLLLNENQSSALYKHKSGRHEALVMKDNNSNEIESKILEIIFSIQPSEIMQKLSYTAPDEPDKQCCKEIFESLQVDCQAICLETLTNRKEWKKQRQFRITGSRCYSLYTYTKNKKPDWNKKSNDYFFPKPFNKTRAIKHGIYCEAFARAADKNLTNANVVEVGLVVSEINPWLGYSPDGIVIDENNKPSKLIEIKCPLAGKTKTVNEILDSVDFLEKNHTLKTKHRYYAQIQFGMSMLNLKETDFIVYASLDNSFLLITVPFDENFTSRMLISLKNVYYNIMLHYICEQNVITK